MKNQIEEQVLKEFKDEWLKKECMKDLKEIIKLTQQKTVQAIFDDIEKGLIKGKFPKGEWRFGSDTDYYKIKKKWGCK